MFANETVYWKCMLEGDQNAFLNIYNHYYPSLFRYGFCLSKDKELTKDCIQELFLELWNKSATVNKNVQDIKSYLFTWLRRKINKAIFSALQQHQKTALLKWEENKEASYEELLIAFQNSEINREKIKHALQHLTKKQLEIIKLRYFDNLSYEEIASRTSLTSRTIYNIIYEALRRLRADVNVMA
jgi:RNA polymerase sigma factor (sigma-70 family)